MILTVDLGTTVTKVVVWGDGGPPIAVGRSSLVSTYGPDNRVEQDAGTWWPSVVAACAAARSALGAEAAGAFGAVDALGFSAARQSFVPVAADATALGPALLWSDRRALAEATSLAASFDTDTHAADGGAVVRARTGVVLDPGSVAAKVAWLQHHEPERLGGARWLLSPRDLIAWRLTGEVATDHTLASATGLYELSGADGLGPLGPLVAGLVDAAADLMPPSRPSDSVLGGLLAGPAGELGLRVGVPVVIGAGDRPCEVLGAGSSPSWPMVSWGTTANVSVPVPRLLGPPPHTMIVTRGALGGWLLEGGLSAAGSLLEWLARLTGRDIASLMEDAASSPPGSRGVVVLPWFGGARAPWWRDTARGGVVGLSFDHDAGDVARAVVESVAWDVTRCLQSVTDTCGSAPAPVGLVLGGGGANVALWTDILTAVTGLSARRRRSGEAASAGAAVLVARATATAGAGADADLGVVLERLDPVDTEMTPDPAMTARYATLRPVADTAADAVIELGR